MRCCKTRVKFSHLVASFSLVCSIALPTSVRAADDTLLDHPLLPLTTVFPGAVIAEYEVQDSANYRLVLGTLQRTRGEVVPDASQKLRGRLTQIVYAMPADLEADDVRDFFAEQLQALEAGTLFACEGRVCGSSNYWANDIFQRRILFGPERNQSYLAARVGGVGVESDESGESVEGQYLAIYVVTRTNKRLYAYVEVLETGDAQTLQVLPLRNSMESQLAQLSLSLDSGFSVPVPGFRFENAELGGEKRALQDSAEGLLTLVQLLEADPQLNLAIVSHLQQEGVPALDLMRQSEERAEGIRAELIARGIDGSRLITAGLGPLKPRCSLADCSARIEIVAVDVSVE